MLWSRRRRTKSPTRSPTGSPTKSPTKSPTFAPVDYYSLPTGTPRTQKVETCRKLMVNPKVQVWLKLTTRRDLEDARKEEQSLLAKQDLARAAASSASAAFQAASQAHKTMTTGQFGLSFTKLIASVTKQNGLGEDDNSKSGVLGRRLLGRGGSSSQARSIQNAEKTLGIGSTLREAKKVKRRFIAKAKYIKFQREKEKKATQIAKRVARANVKAIKKKLRGIRHKLKQFIQQNIKIAGAVWECSRVRLRGCIMMCAD